MPVDISSLAGGGDNPSFRFAKAGDIVVGRLAEEARVVDVEQDGKTRTNLLLTLEVDHASSSSHRKNKNLDGTVTLEPVDLATSDNWTVWVPAGSKMLKALRDAMGAEPHIVVGASIVIKLTGYGQATKPGWSPPGLYEAAYKAPVATAARSINDLI